MNTIYAGENMNKIFLIESENVPSMVVVAFDENMAIRLAAVDVQKNQQLLDLTAITIKYLGEADDEILAAVILKNERTG